MRLFSVLLFALLLASGTVGAQEDALRAAADRYVWLPAIQQNLNEASTPENIAARRRGENPPDVLMGELNDKMAEHFSRAMKVFRPEIEEAMVVAAVETFTFAELEAIVAFLDTAEGAAVELKMPEFDRRRFTLPPEVEQKMIGFILSQVEVEANPE